MGILDAPGLTRTQGDGRYGRRLALIRHAVPSALVTHTPIHPSPPTVAWSGPGGASPITSSVRVGYKSNRLTFLGCKPSDDDTIGYRANGFSAGGPGNSFGIEFEYDGATVCFIIRDANASITDRSVQVTVDGQAISATTMSATGVTASAGGSFRLLLTFPGVGWRRIRLMLRGPHGFIGLETEPTASVRPVAKPHASIAFLADSYGGGAVGTDGVYDIDAIPFWTARALGMECYNGGQGGTGYMNPGAYSPFTNTARLASIVAANPSLVCVLGSVNDDTGYTAGQIQSAATSVYSYLATNLPQTPVIVTGVQPTGSANTLATARFANRAALLAAVAAAPNVLGYVDPIGGGVGVPAAWANATAYVVGDYVNYQGGVYQCVVAHTSAGGLLDRTKFDLTSWINGTSSALAPNGSGNRDVLLASDNVHPTYRGAQAYGLHLARGIASLLGVD